ncbi:MAG: glycogen synthase GlgA [Gammaproteobacteria bacterium]|nr:glycogen synthase GlgA [Gammaproteobacteria bacterium]
MVNMSHPNTPLKILFAASEATPLIKTGGLADIAGSLPLALKRFGHDIRVVLPAYPEAVENTGALKLCAEMNIKGSRESVRIFEGRLKNDIPLYLVDAQALFDRPGRPYTDDQGLDWPDNPQRFTLFCRTIVNISLNQATLDWKPDLVHCNDWQTGLVPALLASEANRPSTLFTIHNLAYQGIYNQATFQQLELPESLWSVDGLEFHDNLSFIKGGLSFADKVNTVSPTYAREILTPEFGYGLEGLLKHRESDLSGILNGIDYQVWDPANDPHINQPFDALTFELKKVNKLKLQNEIGLPEDDGVLLFGHIGRMVEQKGVDLILDILPGLMGKESVQLVMLGSGDSKLEQKLEKIAARYPQKVAARVGYDEGLAHRIEAACDCFLMPSRFEPCGLNQLYSLRYGSVPLVTDTGGLADTVSDASPKNLLSNSATGFVLDSASVGSLWQAMERAIEFYFRPNIFWQKLAVNGMKQDYSWSHSAMEYVKLYQAALNSPLIKR